jgi:hypothetical protein
MSGQAIPVQLNSLETVLHINLQIQEAIGAAPWSQQLFVAGSEDPLSWCADVASLNADDALFLVIDSQANEAANLRRFKAQVLFNALGRAAPGRWVELHPEPPPCLMEAKLGIPYTKGTHARGGQGSDSGWCHWRHFELHPQVLGYYRKDWPIGGSSRDGDRSGEAPQEVL